MPRRATDYQGWAGRALGVTDRDTLRQVAGHFHAVIDRTAARTLAPRRAGQIHFHPFSHSSFLLCSPAWELPERVGSHDCARVGRRYRLRLNRVPYLFIRPHFLGLLKDMRAGNIFDIDHASVSGVNER